MGYPEKSPVALHDPTVFGFLLSFFVPITLRFLPFSLLWLCTTVKASPPWLQFFEIKLRQRRKLRSVGLPFAPPLTLSFDVPGVSEEFLHLFKTSLPVPPGVSTSPPSLKRFTVSLLKH